jgi:hypothetical protein
MITVATVATFSLVAPVLVVLPFAVVVVVLKYVPVDSGACV